MQENQKIAIIGTGGAGRETLCCLLDVWAAQKRTHTGNCCFMVSDEYWETPELMGIPVLPLSHFDPQEWAVLVAIGDPADRKRVVMQLPPTTQFATLIHPTVVLSPWVSIGAGSILAAGTILTCNIQLGRHTQLNRMTTIGHDVVAGDYFTTAPMVVVSGNCRLGEAVYLGAQSCVKQHITMVDGVTVGMGGVVVKPIEEPGVYVGNPVRKIR